MEAVFFIFVGFIFLVFWLVLCAASIYLYFLPTILAYKTKHEFPIGILLLNILLGWTFWGWIGLLIGLGLKKELRDRKPQNNTFVKVCNRHCHC